MVAFLLAFHPAISSTIYPPIYGYCYQVSVPSPAPTTGQATVPVCINGVLQSSAVITIGPTAIPVALPTSYQTAFPTPIPTPTPVPTPAAVETEVPSSATSVTLLAAGIAISGVTFCNNSTQIAYISMVTPATTTSLVTALGAEVSGVPFCFSQTSHSLYHGAWYGIWVSANGTMTVTYW